MAVEFRLASIQDINVLMQFKAEFEAFFEATFDTTKARQAIIGLISDSSLGRLWLIEVDGRAVGYIVLAFGYSIEYGGRDALIDELYLQAGYRSQGIGLAALQFVERSCREWGIAVVHLEVEKTNLPALHLYQKYGFKEHGRRHFMTKWL